MKTDKRIEQAGKKLDSANIMLELARKKLEDERTSIILEQVQEELLKAVELIKDFISDPENSNIETETLLKLAKVTGNLKGVGIRLKNHHYQEIDNILIWGPRKYFCQCY